MSKRDHKRLPHDFHLWTTVASTVDPLRRKGLLKFGSVPLPMPVAEPPPEPVTKAPPRRKPPQKPFLPPRLTMARLRPQESWLVATSFQLGSRDFGLRAKVHSSAMVWT